MGEEHIEPRETPRPSGRPMGPEGTPGLPSAPADRIAAGLPPPLHGKPPEPAHGAAPGGAHGAQPARKEPPPEYKDGVRELVETVVFVVVLVLLLKTFVAEAFVIPTGSMADTLFGYHREFKCAQCGYRYVVNASKEAEERQPARGGYCPNCGFENPVPRAEPQGRGE